MKIVHLHYTYIKPSWKILHVGGSGQPFRRANVVLDNVPFSDREKQNSWVQTIPEYFTENTWYTQPLERTPWPFVEEEFDLVIIDSALVRSRDPIAICKEMERVGKRGYIEIPSLTLEHIRGLSNENTTGYETHRWLVSVKANKLCFTYKHPHIHTKPDFFIIPPKNTKKPYINPNYAIQGIFWDSIIEAYEDYDSAQFPDWFFEENVWKHRHLIKTIISEKDFWNPDAKIPVLLDSIPFELNKLKILNEIPAKFLLNLYSQTGQKDLEMLKFEKLLAEKIYLEQKNKNE